MMWSPAHDLAISLVTLLHWPLAAVGSGRGYYRGEPPGAAVAAARRAGSPWSEQMDRKMLRFVEKRGIRTDQTPPARTEVLPARGEESKPVARPCRGLGGQGVRHFFRGGTAEKKNTHNFVLVEFVALAHARKYPRHIALPFVADIATHTKYRGSLGYCPIFPKSSQLAPSF